MQFIAQLLKSFIILSLLRHRCLALRFFSKFAIIITPMKKNIFLFTYLLLAIQITYSQTISKVGNGIWKITYGTPEKHLPTDFKNPPAKVSLNKLPQVNTPPIDIKNIH